MRPANILNTLDMSGVEDVDVDFDRPVSYPCPAPFQLNIDGIRKQETTP